MIKDLQFHASKPNPSQNFVNHQNELIKGLIGVYNSFPDTMVGGRFLWLEQEILQIENTDPSISGHTIILRTKPNGDNFSFISKSIY